MNIIFLTIGRINNITDRGIYTDLMRKFRDEGHNVYIVAPLERRLNLKTSLTNINGVHILGVKTLNIQKTNLVEKGIGTIMLERQFESAIKRHLFNVSFDLILYSTPPITFTNVVRYLKRNNPNSISYLLLKDIFPQNAVDMQMFSKNSLFYRYFRGKEKKLYEASDYIGCLSPANVEFLLRHNPNVDAAKVEIAPNSIELTEELEVVDKASVRTKYGLPVDKLIFIYGGNLGVPQGVDFLIECLDANMDRADCFFLIVGSGTQYSKLERWWNDRKPSNVRIMYSLPKDEYDKLVQSCDVGLIFLDHRFTIPNYPSRLLSYLEYKMPIIAATDSNCDIGTIAEQSGYGYWCESTDVNAFTNLISKFTSDRSSIGKMGIVGYNYLKDNFLVDNTYNVIIDKIKIKA